MILVLNANYIPIGFTDTKKAICLLMLDKAIVIEKTDEVFNSEHLSFNVPKVLQLKRMVNHSLFEPAKLSKINLFYRDKHLCGYCGNYGDTIEHVVPKVRGGGHRWDNVITACQSCNHTKADKELKDSGLELLYKPFAPSRMEIFKEIVPKEFVQYFP